MLLNKRTERIQENQEIGGPQKSQRIRSGSVESSSSRISQEIDLGEQYSDQYNPADHGRTGSTSAYFLNKAIIKDKLKRENRHHSISKIGDQMGLSYDQSDQVVGMKLGNHNRISSTQVQSNQYGITNEEADEIFQRLVNQNNKRKFSTKRNWSEDETKLLNWAILTYSQKRGMKPQNFTSSDWQNVAKLVPGRNDAQCSYKWNQNHKSSITKTQWQKREDEELFKIISEKGTKQWQDIADCLNDLLMVQRNGKQCRERWYNFLNPEINRDPFTPEEDLQILLLRKQIGNRWSEIVKQLPGRTENSVKNRFNCMFKKVKDEKLLKIQEQNMSEALSKLEGRNSESLVDEEEVIEILITQKTQQLDQIKNEQKLPIQQEEIKYVRDDDLDMLDPSMEKSVSMPQQYNPSLYSNNQTQKKLNQRIAPQDFLATSNSTPNRIQMNYILKQIAQQFPGSVNFLKNLSTLIENDDRDNSRRYTKDRSQDSMSIDMNSQYSKRPQLETSSRMSIENSRDQSSPNLEAAIKQIDPKNGGILEQIGSMRRSRRSYSMVSSLDKLTKKLKNNLLDYERNNKSNNGIAGNLNITKVNTGKVVSQQEVQTISSKKFIAEQSKEVLIVAPDGCYAQKTDQNGSTFLQRLSDVREILDGGSTFLHSTQIQPGQSATGTPTQPTTQNSFSLGNQATIFQPQGIGEMFRPIQLKYVQQQVMPNQKIQAQNSAFTIITPPDGRSKISPQTFLLNGYPNQPAQISGGTPPWNMYQQIPAYSGLGNPQLMGTSPQQIDTRFLLMQPVYSPGQQANMGNSGPIFGQTNPQTGYIGGLMQRKNSHDALMNQNSPQQQIYMLGNHQGISYGQFSPNDFIQNQNNRQE